MAELTEQQLVEANKAWNRAIGLRERIAPVSESGRKVLTAVAPHLQLPWDEPSIEDVHACHRIFGRLSGYWNEDAMLVALREFVRRRNVALLPKPTRRDRIIAILAGDSSIDKTFGDKADRIIAALDGAE